MHKGLEYHWARWNAALRAFETAHPTWWSEPQAIKDEYFKLKYGLPHRDFRLDLSRRYSWWIPTEEALRHIAQYSPIVEMGAGNGYIAWRLRRMGVDITPFDLTGMERNHWASKKKWVRIHRGTPLKLRQKHFKQHTLLLGWPPYNSKMAFEAIRLFSGRRLIYIGEGHGGCTGDDHFHDLLDTEWKETPSPAIPQWDGLHDHMFTFERKESTSWKSPKRPPFGLSKGEQRLLFRRQMEGWRKTLSEESSSLERITLSSTFLGLLPLNATDGNPGTNSSGPWEESQT